MGISNVMKRIEAETPPGCTKHACGNSRYLPRGFLLVAVCFRSLISVQFLPAYTHWLYLHLGQLIVQLPRLTLPSWHTFGTCGMLWHMFSHTVGSCRFCSVYKSIFQTSPLFCCSLNLNLSLLPHQLENVPLL